MEQTAPTEGAAAITSARRKWFRYRFLAIGAGLLVMIIASGASGAWMYQLMTAEPERDKLQASQQVVLKEGEVVASVAKKASPSVVSIIIGTDSPYGQMATGAGTGIIISRDGYVLTNKHVAPSPGENVSIVTADDIVYDDVSVVGTDPLNDIAFLKINNARDLTPATIGDSSKMAIGQKVIAIGNALGQYETTVTSGIISGEGRPVSASAGAGKAVESLSNLFQTDAAINPGNSGGPLLNINGDVIGINTAIAEEAEGIGFAIPINDAKGVIKSVLTTGKVKRPYLGVKYLTINADVAKHYQLSVKDGAYIAVDEGAVMAGGPAAKAGLKLGDVITKIGSTKLDKRHVLSSLISQYTVGEKVSVTVLRDGKSQSFTVTLEEYR